MIRKILGRIKLGLTIIKHVRNWPNVFFNYFGIVHNKYINFKFRNGESIKIRNVENENDTSGLATIWEIFIMKNYSSKGMEIKNEDIIIDVGANIGVFSLYSSKRAKNGKVYAYEPFKTHYKRFLDNIKINNIKNISAFNLAVGGKKQKRELFINESSSGMHSLVFGENSKKKEIINCITLKDIFKENKIKKCDFLKIDCEGAEYEIIYNTPKEILKKIKKISLEFDNIDKEKKNCFFLKSFLEENGFKVNMRGENLHQGILYARK